MWTRGIFNMPLAVTAAFGDEDIANLLHSGFTGADFSKEVLLLLLSSAVTLGCTREGRIFASVQQLKRWPRG
jgi:hypothetical protein